MLPPDDTIWQLIYPNIPNNFLKQCLFDIYSAAIFSLKQAIFHCICYHCKVFFPGDCTMKLFTAVIYGFP